VQLGFWWGNLQERDQLEDSGIVGRIILRWIFWKCDGGLDWIDLAQDRERWLAFENTVMILRVLYNGGNFLTSSEPVSFSRRTLLNKVSNGQWGGKLMGVVLLCNGHSCETGSKQEATRCQVYGSEWK